jgi:hypothetical protein
MKLQNIFKALSEFFIRENMDYGVVGAFALYAYGYVRATRDIDFITRINYQKKIITFLESLGFETTFRSNAFSNHLHSIGSVRIDIMYVEGITADDIFNSTKNRLILNDIMLPVVSAEHLVAMKLFAIKNNPDRKFKDLSDIKEILSHTTYNKKTIKKYFKKYGQDEYYDEIVGDDNED